MKFIIYFYLTSLVFGACDTNANKLVEAYSQISHCKKNYIVWVDGTKMLYDDGKVKTFKERMNNPDIEDMFYFKYPKGSNSYSPPNYNYDPGRIRNEPFMKKMYGHNSREVSQKLTRVSWMPRTANKTVRVTNINEIDRQLKKVSQELDNLPVNLKKYVTTTAGTFNWRKISGTTRLSVHSFGAAIDLNVKYASYWKWKKKYKYNNLMPRQIVEIFEKHGFIWGGKWYHYDTMHFEYRPELL